MGGIISEKWCYFCSNLNTRKVEALGGHLFVPGQVGGVGIQKTRCQNFGNFKTHACLNFQPNWFNITTTSMEKTETGSMNAKGQPVMVMINNWIFHRKSIGQRDRLLHKFLPPDGVAEIYVVAHASVQCFFDGKSNRLSSPYITVEPVR